MTLLAEVARQGRFAGVDVIDRPEFLDLLAGTDRLRRAIERGADGPELIEGWGIEAGRFDEAMWPYRLYPGN